MHGHQVSLPAEELMVELVLELITEVIFSLHLEECRNVLNGERCSDGSSLGVLAVRRSQC